MVGMLKDMKKREMCDVSLGKKNEINEITVK